MRATPRRDKAVQFLRDQSRAALTLGQARLAPIPELAVQAGVAVTTMWAAVRELCREGVLEARPRKGIRIVSAPAQSAGEKVPSTRERVPVAGVRWERVRDAIVDDIARGEYFGAEQLAPAKLLMQRHGVCLPTLRKALRALEYDGVIERERRTWRLCTPRPRAAQSTILFIEWVADSDVLGALDSECSRLGVRLVVVRLFPRETLFETIARARAGAGPGAVIGYLVSITGGSAQQYREILDQIVPSGKPVAVFDTTGGATDTSFPSGANLRVFTIANSRRPGLEMGRFLIHCGHRSVAYIAAAHESVWSVRRLEGIREAFAQAGLADGVREFVAEQPVRLMSSENIEEELAWLTHKLTARGGARHERLARCLSRMQAALSGALSWSHVEDALEPLMERAFKATEVRAWVAANDPMALACVEFLRERGQRVPEDIAVAGFDDNQAAFSAGLTSYNFNRRAAVQAVISFLVYGPQPRAGRPARQIEIDGFVTPRASTRAGVF